MRCFFLHHICTCKISIIEIMIEEKTLVHSYRRMAFKFFAALPREWNSFSFVLLLSEKHLCLFSTAQFNAFFFPIKDLMTLRLESRTSYLMIPSFCVKRLSFLQWIWRCCEWKHARNVQVMIITATRNLRFLNYPGWRDSRTEKLYCVQPITSLPRRIVLKVKEWKLSNYSQRISRGSHKNCNWKITKISYKKKIVVLLLSISLTRSILRAKKRNQEDDDDDKSM